MKILSIEGNIGAGKTTVLNELQNISKNNSDICIMLEPIELWENIKDNKNISILERFYEDQDKYAFTFQIMALATRIKKIRTIIENNPNMKVLICERSLEADYNIFAKMLYKSGKIKDIDYQVYLELYNIYKNDYPLDGVIYINTSPIVCYERIKKRSRDGESDIPMDYLNDCHEHHQKWLNNKDMVLPINTETDWKNTDVKKDIISKMNKYMLDFIKT